MNIPVQELSVPCFTVSGHASRQQIFRLYFVEVALNPCRRRIALDPAFPPIKVLLPFFCRKEQLSFLSVGMSARADRVISIRSEIFTIPVFSLSLYCEITVLKADRLDGIIFRRYEPLTFSLE